jgi:hypothetical protein
VLRLVDIHGALLGDALVVLLVHAGMRRCHVIWRHPECEQRPQYALHLHPSHSPERLPAQRQACLIVITLSCHIAKQDVQHET